MITDNVKLYIKAGDGGNGCVSFHREKYVARGGPDGGDGGNGGNIVLVIDEGANTLLKYKYRHKFVAENGGDGGTSKFHGKNAEDTILPVPPGTIVRDAASGKIICDMSDCGPFILCKGGRGGWGNKHFATPTRQIPRFAKSGIRGEEKEVIFELKMLADVGLIGLPNVGKSSILAAISSAKPKIADYEFTTLSPSLGVVSTKDGDGFVCADIPGIIGGASEGAGLGHKFLRHIDRCRLLLHVVDVSGLSGRNPVDDIKLINSELEKYSPELAKRPQMLIGNKFDSVVDEDSLKELERYADENDLELIYVSAVTGFRIEEMIDAVAERLRFLPPLTVYEPEYVEEKPEDSGNHDVSIKSETGVYTVEAEWLYRLVGSVNFEDRDSLRYFQKVLKNSGIIEKLEEAGCKDGDTVSIYDFEFDFVK